MAKDAISLTLCVLVVIAVLLDLSSGQTAVGPANLTRRVGDYAEFTCAGNPSEIVSWYFYNPSLTKLFSSPNSLFVDPKKYAVNTGAVAGTYTLGIYNLILNDGGQYACDRQNEPAKFYASLVVVDHPMATVIPPTTSVGSMPGLNVGDTITLTCRVQYAAPTMDAGFTSSIGYPQEPQIQMFLGEQNLTNRSSGGQISYQNTIGSPTHYKILTVNYTIRANYTDDQRNGSGWRNQWNQAMPGNMEWWNKTRNDRKPNVNRTSNAVDDANEEKKRFLDAKNSKHENGTFRRDEGSAGNSPYWKENILNSTHVKDIIPHGKDQFNDPKMAQYYMRNDTNWTRQDRFDDPAYHPYGARHEGRRLHCDVTTLSPVFFESSSAPVNVNTPVTFVWVDHPLGLVITLGHKDYCQANGFPAPTVSWVPLYTNLTASDGQTGQTGNATLTPSKLGQHYWNCTASNSLNTYPINTTFGPFQVVDMNMTAGAASFTDSTALGVGLGIGLGVPILIGLIVLGVCLAKRRRGGSNLEKKKVPPPYVATSSTAPKTSSAPIYKPATKVKNPEKSGVPKGIVNPNPDPSREPLLQEPASGVHPMGRNSPGFGDLGVKQITGSVPTLDESFNSNTNRSFDNDRAQPEATVRNNSGSTGSGRNASAV